jgi:hypothetical protein
MYITYLVYKLLYKPWAATDPTQLNLNGNYELPWRSQQMDMAQKKFVKWYMRLWLFFYGNDHIREEIHN